MDSIETARTFLRRFMSSDLPCLRQLEENPLIMKFTPTRVPLNWEQSRQRLESQIQKQSEYDPFGICGAFDKENLSFVGWFMLLPRDPSTLELGFMLVQEQWRKGFATEIGKALVSWAQTQKNIRKLTAQTDKDNLISKKTLEKLGFEYTKTVLHPDRILGRDVPLDYYEKPF